MRCFTLAALALALLIPNVASAQREHGRRDGGAVVSHDGGRTWTWSGARSWDGGRYWGGYYGNRWYNPYFSFNWGYGGPYYYGYSWPGNYYYSYDYPSTYYYSYPSTVYYDSYPRVSNYYDPMADSSYSMMMSPNRVRLNIMVPDSNAELFIQGQKMNLMGNQRVFFSPDLDPGKTYTYTITFKRNISGRMEDDTRKIDVQGGSNIEIDFARPQIKSMPAPKPSGERLPPK